MRWWWGRLNKHDSFTEGRSQVGDEVSFRSLKGCLIDVTPVALIQCKSILFAEVFALAMPREALELRVVVDQHCVGDDGRGAFGCYGRQFKTECLEGVDVGADGDGRLAALDAIERLARHVGCPRNALRGNP